MNNKKLAIIFLSFFVFFIFILISNPWSYNGSGYRSHIQTITGEESIRFKPGIYYSGFFAKVTSYPDVITVQYGDESEEASDVTYFASPHGVRFNDGTKAKAGHTVKWDLPEDPDMMIQIHKHYRSHERLANTTLSQFQKECMNYACQLMESETHYSGGQSQLKEDFQYQLRNGQYLINQIEEWFVDTTTGEREKMYIKEKRKDINGNYILSKSDVQKYNIKPSFVSIDYFDYEAIVDKKLEKKIELATQESNSKQALITARQEALTAEMDGKKRIAQTKAEQEAIKIKAVIEAEKQTAIAKEEAEKAKFVAQKIKYEKEAEAAANKALVNAGLTPRDRAQYENERAIGIARELSKLNLPEIMVLGSGDGASVDPFTAVGLKSIIDITENMSKKNQ